MKISFLREKRLNLELLPQNTNFPAQQAKMLD
jgi:hypothetical protein